MQEPRSPTEFNVTAAKPLARNKNALKNPLHNSLLPKRKKLLRKIEWESQNGKMLADACGKC